MEPGLCANWAIAINTNLTQRSVALKQPEGYYKSQRLIYTHACKEWKYINMIRKKGVAVAASKKCH